MKNLASSLMVSLMLGWTVRPVGAQDLMYTLTGAGVTVLDPMTGEYLRSTPLSVSPPGHCGMTHDGSRLLAIHSGLLRYWPDELLSIHPADGQGTFVGPTGFNGWQFISIEHDPTTGKTFVVNFWDVYTLDISSGALTWISTLDGLLPGDALSSIAIDSNGAAYGIGLVGTVELEVYRLDLAGGTATHLGGFPAPPAGWFQDLAFDGNGQLWGNLSHGGLYRINPSVPSINLTVPNIIVRGLAFGPDTEQTTYCSSKTSSTGCLPTIAGIGIASPTAASGYQITGTNTRNNAFGMLHYSLAGRASQPFAGGLACIQTPWIRTRIANSGGSSGPVKDCSGTWAVDLNAELARKPALPAGTILNCQWMGRDPGYAPPDNYSLSDGLELTLLP